MEGVGEVKDGGLDEGVEEDMVREWLDFEALKPHPSEELERQLRFAGDRIADHKCVMEARDGADGATMEEGMTAEIGR